MIKPDGVNLYYTGWVTDVTRDSITIQEYGPPRRFAVTLVLALGGYPKDETPCCSYKLTQVQVGDSVSICYSRTNGVEVCKAIAIRRRPGGKVPPGNYRPGLVMEHPPHEAAQAYQDFEEKGVPLPPWMRPAFEDLPVAPQPRARNAPVRPAKP